jgi:hypothetical protein
MLNRPHTLIAWTALASAASLGGAVALTPLWLAAAESNHGSPWLTTSLWLVFLALATGFAVAVALSVVFYRSGLAGQMVVAVGAALVAAVASLVIALNVVQNQIGIIFVAGVLFASLGTYQVLINLGIRWKGAIAPAIPQIGIVCGASLLLAGLLTLFIEIGLVTIAVAVAICAYVVWSVLLAMRLPEKRTQNPSPS